MREIEADVVSTVTATRRAVHIGVIVAVVGVGIKQGFKFICHAVAVGIADARQFGFLANHYTQAFFVLGDNTQAVKSTFRKQLPLAFHHAPNTGGTGGDYYGVVFGQA